MSAANINRVTVTGNLTRDPELKAIRENGPRSARCGSPSTAVARTATTGSTSPTSSTSRPGAGLGKLCHDFLSKGRGVAIDGRLDWREWDGQDEKHHEAVTIVAENIHFLPRSATSQAKEQAEVETEETHRAPTSRRQLRLRAARPRGAWSVKLGDDDIPF